jgi:uncharacterized protein (DUF1800 family)
MLVLNDCNTGTLAPYVPGPEKPWGIRQVQHLFRRAGFGEDFNTLEAATALSPSDLVDQLVDEAINLPLSTEPDWSNDTYNPNNPPVDEMLEKVVEWSGLTIRELLENRLRSKLVLFWSNHFVTKIESYLCPSYLYRYHNILQEYALGNFKRFTEEIGKTPAMLIFLNGVQNTRFEPNENYARELLELFTLGRDNGYTQNDIAEAARALTGFNGFNFNMLCDEIGYVPAFHDPGNKTIFGVTDNFDYQGLHDLLFDIRRDEIAEYICRKIYIEFVAPQVSDEIVLELANVFKANNFEIAPVIRTLLKSDHFFDETVLGTKVKSPYESYLQLIKELDVPYDQGTIDTLYLVTTDQGQQLYNPPNVAGWPGNRSWVDSTTLPKRWEIYDLYIFVLFTSYTEQLRDLVKRMTSNSNEVEEVVQSIVEYMIPVGLTTDMEFEEAVDVFKDRIPQNYFEDGSWNLDWDEAPYQIILLLRHLVRLPDFQIF